MTVHKKLLALALSLSLLALMALVACAPKVNTENYTGEWTLAYGSQDGMDAETVTLAKSLGKDVTLTLAEDGTGTLDLFGEEAKLTWVASSDSEGTVMVDDSNDATMKLEDGFLNLYDADGDSLSFARPQE